MNDQTEEELRTRRRWRVRRRMAKTAFVAGLIYPLPCMIEPTLTQLGVYFYGFITAVITVYIGGSTYDDVHNPGGK